MVLWDRSRLLSTIVHQECLNQEGIGQNLKIVYIIAHKEENKVNAVDYLNVSLVINQSKILEHLLVWCVINSTLILLVYHWLTLLILHATFWFDHLGLLLILMKCPVFLGIIDPHLFCMLVWSPWRVFRPHNRFLLWVWTKLMFNQNWLH